MLAAALKEVKLSKFKYFAYCLIANFLSFFIVKKSNRVIITSTHNNSFNFNSKPIFLYMLNNSNYNVKFIITDEKKRDDLIRLYGEHFISLYGLKNMVFILRSKVWVSSSFELPYIFLKRDRNRRIIHLGHGVPLKKIGLAEEKISFLQKLNRYLRAKQFTDIIAYSQYFEPYIREVFRNNKARYLHLGQPRNDKEVVEVKCSEINLLNKLMVNCEAKARFFLYAPTWRSYAPTKFFPFDDYDMDKLYEYLKNNNIYLLIRAHPFYPALYPDSFAFNSHVIDFGSRDFPDIDNYLHLLNGLITDYSSIYLDFLRIGKVAFIPYDLDRYEQEVGFSVDYNTHTPGPIINSQDSLVRYFGEFDNYSIQRNSLANDLNIKNENNCREILSLIDECANS